MPHRHRYIKSSSTGPNVSDRFGFQSRVYQICAVSRKANSGVWWEKLRYVTATVEDALSALTPSSFDMVYISIDSLCWLPRIRHWARVVAGVLKPEGRLFMRETHPMVWTIDETKEGLAVKFPYFEQKNPVMFADGGTYIEVPQGTEFTTEATAEFFHGMVK